MRRSMTARRWTGCWTKPTRLLRYSPTAPIVQLRSRRNSRLAASRAGFIIARPAITRSHRNAEQPYMSGPGRSSGCSGGPAEISAAGERIDVLDAGWQRRRMPSFAAVLGAKHLAVARGDIDLICVVGVQADRHQRAVRLDLVE